MFDGDRVKDSDHGTAHRAIETVHAFDVGALSGRSFGAGYSRTVWLTVASCRLLLVDVPMADSHLSHCAIPRSTTPPRSAAIATLPRLVCSISCGLGCGRGNHSDCWLYADN